jgi:Ca2+-binding RTX toxin-like protein
VYGDEGDDELYGDNATDSALNDGSETIYGDAGNDQLYGGGGTDPLLVMI